MGKLFSTCLNVILLESGSKKGRVLKLLVEVDLHKPMMRGTKITLESEEIWEILDMNNCIHSAFIVDA